MTSTETEKTSAAPFFDVLESGIGDPKSGLPTDMVTNAIKTLARFRGTCVELEVPRQIAKEISSGKLFRHGGVVRDAGGKIRLILKDPAAVGKLLKGPAIMFALVDIAQAVLLNEKLKEIQKQLQSIEDKVDQLLESKLTSGFEEARQIPLYSKPAERNKRVHSALDFITESLALVKKAIMQQADLLKRKVREADPNQVAFFGSRTKARGEALDIAKKLQKQIHFLSSLLSLRAKLQEELKEFRAAERSRAEISATILAWAEFFHEQFNQGGPMRPYGGETNPANYVNILSMEPMDYRIKTAELCQSFLADIAEEVEICVLDHTITKVISQGPLPTYSD